MLSRAPRTALAVLAAFLLSTVALAQQAEVTRNVNLRQDPSTSQDPIRLLHPPEALNLIERTPTAGYYHVATAEGEEGWVWGHNIHILTETPSATPTPTPTPQVGVTPATPTSTPAVSPGPATAVDEAWDKPTPDSEDFQSKGKTCGPSGQGGDTDTNLRKNRIDVPPSYHEVTWDTVAQLSFPSDKPERKDWSSPHLTQIARFEGVAVAVVGYLSHKIQVEQGESTNCGWTDPTEVDWHMYLTKQPKQPISQAVIVETTPRVRTSHPNWTTTVLSGWVENSDPTRRVRISGWLMLDPLHADQIGTNRETIWEIHPVTKIEIFSGGQWVDLDQ